MSEAEKKSEADEKLNAAWMIITCFAEAEGFTMGREKRIETITYLNDKLAKYRAGRYPMPEWLPDAIPGLVQYLEFAEACADRAEKAPSTAEAARIMMRGFLKTRHSQLLPQDEAQARGAALAMDVASKFRLKAAETDPIAFDIACMIAADYTEKGGEMPPEWRSFAAKVLSGKIKRPRPKNGQKAYANLFKDNVICSAIEYGETLGLAPTRNDVSSTLSGCDVVATYLSEHGMFPATFAGVKRIWLARGEGIKAFQRTMIEGE